MTPERHRSDSELFNQIYDQLNKIAHHLFAGERRDHTLQPTAVLHEALIRLLESKQPLPQDRGHLLALSAKVMRRVLVEHARRYHAFKRGNGMPKVPFRDEDTPVEIPLDDLLALDEVLSELETLDSNAYKVLELFYFGGFPLKEITCIVGRHYSTVRKDMRDGMAWVRQRMARTHAKS